MVTEKVKAAANHTMINDLIDKASDSMMHLNSSLDVISENQTRNQILRVERGDSATVVSGSQENLNSLGTTDLLKKQRKRSDVCVTQVNSASKPENEFDAAHVYDMNLMQQSPYQSNPQETFVSHRGEVDLESVS